MLKRLRPASFLQHSGHALGHPGPTPCPPRSPSLCRWIQKCSYLTYALSAIIQSQFDATTFYDESVSCWAALGRRLSRGGLHCTALGSCSHVGCTPLPIAGSFLQPKEDMPCLPLPPHSLGLHNDPGAYIGIPPPNAPPMMQGTPVPGSELVPSNLQTGLSVGGNTLVLFALMVGIRMVAYAAIEAGALLKLI